MKKGQLLARVDSPELMSRRVQERSTLQALQSDLGRQEIAARQAAQRAKQTADILAMRLAAAERAMTRASELSAQGLINRVDFERAKDELELARLEAASAGQTAQFERESLTFEVQNRRPAGRPPAVGGAGDGAPGAAAARSRRRSTGWSRT